MDVPSAGADAGGSGVPVLDAVLLEAPALLERAISYTRAALALLPHTDPDAPTPCPDWTLTRLLRHMDDSLAAFTEAAEAGYVAPAGPATPHPAQLAASLRDRACRLLGAWAHEPGRPHVSVAGAPIETTLLAATGAIEIAVHGWDVVRACGEDRPIPEALAASLLVVAPLVIGPADRCGRFAPAYDVSPAADACARLLAFLGR